MNAHFALRPRRAALRGIPGVIAALAILAGPGALTVCAAGPVASAVRLLRGTRTPAARLHHLTVVQDNDDSAADSEVAPEQIQKYVAVYRAMQRNHSLTVEQAAASQGLTMGAFRRLEERIERNDLTRDDARRELAAPADEATPAPRARR